MVAFVCIVVGILLGGALSWLCFPSESRDLALAVFSWAAASFLYFFSPSSAAFMVMMVVTLIFLSPRDPSKRIFFYCAMLLALPIFVEWRIPFPGINYLFNLTYIIILNIVVLLPLVFRTPRAQDTHVATNRTHARVVQIVLFYIAFTVLLDFRSTTFTNGLRQMVESFLSFGIPVIVLGRFSLKEPVVERAIFGIFTTGIFACCIALMQLVTQWYIYSEAASTYVLSGLDYIEVFRPRGGQVRVPGPAAHPIPFGLYLALCCTIAIAYIATRKRMRIALLLLPALSIGLIASGARAGLLTFSLGILVLLFFSRRLRRLRSLIGCIGIPVVVLIGFVGDTYQVFVGADPYGTFAYRIDLIKNSLNSISSNLLLGTPDFWFDPTLQLSRQGQGIIDIVNAYLRVILQYGAVGLFLFALPLWIVIRTLLKHRAQCESVGNLPAEYLARLLLALLIGYSVSIATVSLIGRLQHYFWILLILSSAISARPYYDKTSAGSPD